MIISQTDAQIDVHTLLLLLLGNSTNVSLLIINSEQDLSSCLLHWRHPGAFATPEGLFLSLESPDNGYVGVPWFRYYGQKWA